MTRAFNVNSVGSLNVRMPPQKIKNSAVQVMLLGASHGRTIAGLFSFLAFECKTDLCHCTLFFELDFPYYFLCQNVELSSWIIPT